MSTSTEPIFDSSGQVASPRLSKPTSAGEHAFRPSADDGFTVIPSGSVTTAFSRCAVAQPVRVLVLRDAHFHVETRRRVRLGRRRLDPDRRVERNILAAGHGRSVVGIAVGAPVP